MTLVVRTRTHSAAAIALLGASRVLLICAAVAASSRVGDAAGSPGTSASFSPTTSYVAPGETCDVSVRIDSAADSIACIECWVAFDTSLVEIVNAQEGSLFTTAPYPRYFVWLPIAADTHSVEGCLLGYRTCAVTPGEIARYTFRARKAGVCPVRISRLRLLGVDRTSWFEPVADPNAWIVIGTATGILDPPGPYRIGCHPNPFEHSTTISLSPDAEAAAQSAETVAVGIYSADGRLVKELAGNEAGGHAGSFIWDGTDTDGNRAASGVYFACARTPSGVIRTKVVLMR